MFSQNSCMFCKNNIYYSSVICMTWAFVSMTHWCSMSNQNILIENGQYNVTLHFKYLGEIYYLKNSKERGDSVDCVTLNITSIDQLLPFSHLFFPGTRTINFYYYLILKIKLKLLKIFPKNCIYTV